MTALTEFLEASRARHSHLCPRQVLGVRIGLKGLELLNIDVQERRKKLLVIAETYGCFVDGIEVTARVSAGHRSLRIEDYGKIAATFVHLQTGRAVRVSPRTEIRQLASRHCPEERRAYFAQLKAYQIISDDELLRVEWVTMKQAVGQIMGRPGQRTYCVQCGEDIINGREVIGGGICLCKSCAGEAYYRLVEVLPGAEYMLDGASSRGPTAGRQPSFNGFHRKAGQP